MPAPITDMPTDDQLFLTCVICGDSEHLYLVYGRYLTPGHFMMIELEAPKELVNDFMLLGNVEGYMPTFDGQFRTISYPKKRFMPGRLFEQLSMEEGELDDEAEVKIVERFIFSPTQTPRMLERVGVDNLCEGIERAIKKTEAASQLKELDHRVAFDRVEKLTKAKQRLEFVMKVSKAQENRARTGNALLDRLREIQSGKQPPQTKNI